jgi:trehalose 6-phosphate synthase
LPTGTTLYDADFVVVANRLPVDLEKLPDGSQRWKRSPGGLVTALEPMLRSRDGAWVGWPGLADADVEPLVEDGLQLYPVRLSAREVEDYYEGFSNGTLWPLYHDVVAPPAFHRHWWQAYVRVNERFAEVVAEVASRNATVWIQDYQLQLLPAALRKLRPDLRIGFFLHIPFPPTELFMQLPWRRRIIEGLLGADLVGFHTPGGVRNFRWLATRLTDAVPGHGRTEVTYGGRTVKLGAFPISIDSAALDQLSRTPEVAERAKQIRSDLGEPEKVVLGVDRLDYTKGIDVRLRALEELLIEGRVSAEDVVMIQLATPRRERVEH